MKGLASICDTCCWLLIWFSGSSCSLTRVECFRHFSWHRRRSCSPRTCSSPSPMLLNYSSQFLCFEHRIPHSHSILSVPHRLRDGLVAIHRMFDSYLSRMGSFPCYGDLQAQSNDRSSRLQQAMLQHSIFWDRSNASNHCKLTSQLKFSVLGLPSLYIRWEWWQLLGSTSPRHLVWVHAKLSAYPRLDLVSIWYQRVSQPGARQRACVRNRQRPEADWG